jgi:hypothetical protein
VPARRRVPARPLVSHQALMEDSANICEKPGPGNMGGPETLFLDGNTFGTILSSTLTLARYPNCVATRVWEE